MLIKRKWKRRMMWISFAVIALLALSLGGCGSKEQIKAKQVKTYGHDGYMGYSNSNPNIPNGFSYLNYESDGKFAGEVLKGIDGIKSSRLSFNGQYLRVYATVDPTITNEEMKQLQKKTQDIVQYNMPRYHVKVETVR